MTFAFSFPLRKQNHDNLYACPLARPSLVLQLTSQLESKLTSLHTKLFFKIGHFLILIVFLSDNVCYRSFQMLKCIELIK